MSVRWAPDPERSGFGPWPGTPPGTLRCVLGQGTFHS